ncbi:GTPase HflX, partial [Francisellaceae bacterium]|nr:GTPase HflX [Francisellaceae bacterium]
MQLFEAKQGGDQCLLINVTFSTKFELNADLTELIGLADAASLLVVKTLELNKSVPDPKFFIGTGKTEELLSIISAQNINLVIFNHP